MRQRIVRPAWTVAALVSIAAMLLSACALVSAPPSAASSIALPDPATDWQAISEAGVMVVGVAVDYPPFEYYTDSFQVDGFDPALMRAIGQQLGVEIEFVDLAFDGIGQALAAGQVDAAISALSETPERASVLDFSLPYFISEDAYLVDSGSTLVVKTPADLQNLRVAVQLGSIYEDLIQKTLVDTGLIAPRNVIRYDDIAGAVRDLASARVDIVVLDLLAAQRFIDEGAARLAGQGLNTQRYAIAVRKGSDELRQQLDRSLDALRTRGALARLAEQYLGIPLQDFPALPTESIAAAREAAATPSCLNAMAWVSSLSYDDLEMMAPPVMFPGQPFAKAWRVQNIGTCTWDESYFVTFARGNAPGAAMGGAPTNLRGSVAPGEIYDLSVDLVAPLLPGVYQALWEMRDGDGRALGQTLRVGVQVAGAPTPTPAPTLTPAPGIVFYADATRALRGQPVTFVWDVQDAQTVYFYQDGEDWQVNDVAAVGQQIVIPDRTTGYNLRVERSDGSVETRTINVEALPDAGPQIEFFAVTPNDNVPLGVCVDISWRVVGQGAQITLTRNQEELWEDAPQEGHLEDCPTMSGNAVYQITATDAAGADTRQQTVRMVEAMMMMAQKVDGAPIIDIFAVTPENIDVNGCVVVNWKVGGDVKTIQILRNDTVILDGAPLTGSGQNCLTDVGEFRYRLEATSSISAVSSAEVNVTVSPAVQTAPAGAVSASDPELTGKTWVLISMFDGVGAMTSPLAGSQITAAFAADGGMAGLAGCNNYNSAYSTANGSMSIGLAISTRKFCAKPAGVMDQEAFYLALLPTVASYTIQNGRLTLLNGVAQEVAVYVVGQ